MFVWSVYAIDERFQIVGRSIYISEKCIRIPDVTFRVQKKLSSPKAIPWENVFTRATIKNKRMRILDELS